MPTNSIQDNATVAATPRATSRRSRVTTSNSTTPISVSEDAPPVPPTFVSPMVVSLDSYIYPGGPTVPVEATVVTHEGVRIRRSDHVILRNGEIWHNNDPRLGTCPRCSCLINEEAEESVLTRAAGNHSSERVQRYCPACDSNYTWTCTRCDIHVSDDVTPRYASDDDNEDHPLCPRCVAPPANSLFGRMLNYSNKDISNVPPKDPGGMLYGWEVEVHLLQGASPQRAVDELHRILGPGYYVTKPDGSVENGFEIVTRPDSMAVHREEWCRFFEAIKASEFLRSHLRSWEAPRQCCGIHCHIDKESLSALQLGKLATWINHPNNRAFIEKVAGRGSGSYTSFSDSVRVSDGRKLKQSTGGTERYVALNVQNKTAEMRIFRGTLQPRLFFKNMDFVEASVEWTGLSSCSARHVTDVSRFVRYIYDRRERFPFLYDKIVEWKFEPSAVS